MYFNATKETMFIITHFFKVLYHKHRPRFSLNFDEISTTNKYYFYWKSFSLNQTFRISKPEVQKELIHN